MRKTLMGGMAVFAFALTTPVWADRGDDNWRHDRHWHRHHVHERVVAREYSRPVPVYQQAVYPAYQAPEAGIHIVLPNISIRFP